MGLQDFQENQQVSRDDISYTYSYYNYITPKITLTLVIGFVSIQGTVRLFHWTDYITPKITLTLVIGFVSIQGTIRLFHWTKV